MDLGNVSGHDMTSTQGDSDTSNDMSYVDVWGHGELFFFKKNFPFVTVRIVLTSLFHRVLKKKKNREETDRERRQRKTERCFCSNVC